jgi:hypothetical protein
MAAGKSDSSGISCAYTKENLPIVLEFPLEAAISVSLLFFFLRS